MATSTICNWCAAQRSNEDYYRRSSDRTKIRQPCKQCLSDYAAERWKNGGAEARRQHLYGLTPQQFLKIRQLQCNKCAICRDQFTAESPPHVDHDHDTGATRGLTCGSCNIGLGKLRDSIEVVESALRYLLFPPAEMFDF